MRIGIDARFLNSTQAGGFKTYTENLIRALGELEDGNEYVLFLERRIAADDHPGLDRFEQHVVDVPVPVVHRQLREQTLPLCMSAGGFDVLHFPCNTAPLTLPGNSVLTLHDTIQVMSAPSWSLSAGLSGAKRALLSEYASIVIRTVVRRALFVITVSRFERERIVSDLGVDPARVRVVYLAPNPVFRRFSETEFHEAENRLSTSLGLRRPFALGVGYEPRKNIDLLIRAFASIAGVHPDLQLVVAAADGASRASFRSLAHSLGVEGRVLVLEGMPCSELAALYNLADAMAFPSNRESFGLPPLEAQACGAPVIAARSSSLPEILGDGALYVEPGSQADLARTLHFLIENADLRATLSERGLARAQSYSWRRTARETVAVYEEAAAARMYRHEHRRRPLHARNAA